MASPISPFSIGAPGFYGLNTQDSPVDLDKGFALEANNCVIDKSGRIASRKGWAKAHTANADIGANAITCIGEVVQNDGTSTIVAAGGGYLFKLVGTTLTTLTYGGGGVAPTINANNWQFCQMNGIGMFWQRGYDPLIYDPAVSTTQFRRLSEKAGSAGTIYQCNVAIAAYGRVWSADTSTDKSTVVWSDILTPHIWTGGTAGSLDLRQVWPMGGDEVVAMAAHNNFLYIFGKRQTLIYAGADNPSTMVLADSIVGIGCIARDSVQNTGEDTIFLAADGVRSIMRTIQEKSAPLKTLSSNVQTDVQGFIALEDTSLIKSGYSSSDAFYVLTFPSSAISYCFDVRGSLQNGSNRVTTWSSIDPKAMFESGNKTFYMGQTSYVGTHTGYYDDTSNYRMSYFTTWIDFGNPIQTSILKKAIITLIGLSNQTIVFKWAYDYVQTYFSQTTVLSGISAPAEYGTAEYGLAEYSGNVAINAVSVSGSSAGKVLQFGIEAQVGGYKVSIQRIDIYTKDGRLQ